MPFFSSKIVVNKIWVSDSGIWYFFKDPMLLFHSWKLQSLMWSNRPHVSPISLMPYPVFFMPYPLGAINWLRNHKGGEVIKKTTLWLQITRGRGDTSLHKKREDQLWQFILTKSKLVYKIKIHLRTDYSTFFYISHITFLRIVNISNHFCKYIT